LLVDARLVDRFLAETEEPRAGLRSGHIPGSINIPIPASLKDGKYCLQRRIKKIFSTRQNHCSMDLV
jgi:thiosulfate/3-mercaptopyruvate sulfurtransferase